MENQDTSAPVPIPEDQPKTKEQIIDPWNVSGEVGEDGNVKPIGMFLFLLTVVNVRLFNQCMTLP